MLMKLMQLAGELLGGKFCAIQVKRVSYNVVSW